MIIVLLITIAYLILLYLDIDREAIEITPDGRRYYSGNKLIMPYHLRWLLPYLCRQSELLWNIFTLIPLVVMPLVMYEYLLLKGIQEQYAVLGSVLLLGLPGVTIVNFYGKYLTDGFGMMTMLTAIYLYELGLIELAILTAVIGTMANEKVFVFCFLITLNYLFLIPLIAVLIRFLLFKKADKDFLGGDEIAKRPLSAGIKYHRNLLFDYKIILLTWGVGILGIINSINQPLTLLPLSAGYLMIFFATDTVRLFQWSFPIVILLAVHFISFLISDLNNLIVTPVLMLLGLLHLYNPFRRNML